MRLITNSTDVKEVIIGISFESNKTNYLFSSLKLKFALGKNKGESITFEIIHPK